MFESCVFLLRSLLQLASLQTHVYSTLKRRGNDRLYVILTWNSGVIFVGMVAMVVCVRFCCKYLENTLSYIESTCSLTKKNLEIIIMLIATPVNDDLDQKHSLIFELKRPQPSQ